MEQSIGRASEPTTDADEPDARELDPDVLRRVRDVPPHVGYENTAFTDPDAERRTVDPLDLRRPSRENGDPLDPDGHVI